MNINVEKLKYKIDQSMEREIRVSPCHTNRASELGHPCVRYLVFNRTRWEDKLPHSIDLQYIFAEGNIQEDAVIDRLRKAKFEVSESQRAIFDKNTNISGHIDGKIFEESFPHSIPMEIKGLSTFNWASINSYKDMLTHKRYYVRKYPAQLQLYMYMTEYEDSLFVLKNKGNGQIKFIHAELDLEYVEGLLKKAEMINKCVAENKIPDETTEDLSVCGGCAFNHLCFKDQEARNALIIHEDSVLEEKIERMEELKEYFKEYGELKEEVGDCIKSRAKLDRAQEGRAEYLIGNYCLTAQLVKGTKYNIPKEVKQQYAVPNPYWKFNGVRGIV